ncbi:MAG: hypothetical protein KF712_16170 [Akkermansiaceae bacterium]|nr:hypothetical protein [Akkermansiaceae bacterium]
MLRTTLTFFRTVREQFLVRDLSAITSLRQLNEAFTRWAEEIRPESYDHNSATRYDESSARNTYRRLSRTPDLCCLFCEELLLFASDEVVEE